MPRCLVAALLRCCVVAILRFCVRAATRPRCWVPALSRYCVAAVPRLLRCCVAALLHSRCRLLPYRCAVALQRCRVAALLRCRIVALSRCCFAAWLRCCMAVLTRCRVAAYRVSTRLYFAALLSFLVAELPRSYVAVFPCRAAALPCCCVAPSPRC